MDYFGVFKTSASALFAQRQRMNVLASNLANIHTTRTEEGGPYKRKDVIFQSMLIEPNDADGPEGVQVAKIVEDQSPPVMVYDPAHPDANGEGYVAMPNVNSMEEMVNMMTAVRSYEANVAAFNISKGMFLKALELGR